MTDEQKEAGKWDGSGDPNDAQKEAHNIDGLPQVGAEEQGGELTAEALAEEGESEGEG